MAQLNVPCNVSGVSPLSM